MAFFKRSIPVALAVIFGLATLLGLLVFPGISDVILGWASLLAAVALIVGVLNLFVVHLRRGGSGNGPSIILVLSMLAVFALAVTDGLGVTEAGVATIFNQVQAPLEAALASLLVFFLLFAGVRLLHRQRNVWSALFLLTAVTVLLSQSPLPQALNDTLAPVRAFINEVLVTAGMRGLLLGVALGTVTLSLRLLAGLERPYSK